MKRIATPLLDVRVQLLAITLLILSAWSRLSPASEPEHPWWEVVFPPHPMMCDRPHCHACKVILAEYEQRGEPLKP